LKSNLSPDEKMHRMDDLLTHLWMVRTFLKHSEEVEEDEELHRVHRRLYDFMHALGDAWNRQDADAYLRQATKKWHRLRETAAMFSELQPEVSEHTNFQMARRSLEVTVHEIGSLLEVSDAKETD